MTVNPAVLEALAQIPNGWWKIVLILIILSLILGFILLRYDFEKEKEEKKEFF